MYNTMICTQNKTVTDQTEVTSFSNGAYNGEPEYNEVHNRKHHKQRLQRQQSTVSGTNY